MVVVVVRLLLGVDVSVEGKAQQKDATRREEKRGEERRREEKRGEEKRRRQEALCV